MIREMKYGALFGKASAMSGKLLRQNDYRALMQKKSVSEVVLYLKHNTQYGSILSDVDEKNIRRDNLENLLKRDLLKDYTKLIKFTRGQLKEFIKIRYIKKEIESLKLIIRAFEAGKAAYKDLEDSLVFMAKHDAINIPRLALSRNLEEFISGLKGTQYYKLLKPFISEDYENRLFNMEMVLDLFYLANTRKTYQKLLDKPDSKIVRELLGIEADIFNIFWIYRSKRFYNMEPEIIKSYAAHLVYKLKKRTIETLISTSDFEKYFDLVRKTPYGLLFEGDNQKLFEHNYLEYIYKHHKRQFRAQPFSIACILSYLRIKEIELNNIISIIEGVHYNLPEKKLQKFVVGLTYN